MMPSGSKTISTCSASTQRQLCCGFGRPCKESLENAHARSSTHYAASTSQPVATPLRYSSREHSWAPRRKVVARALFDPPPFKPEKLAVLLAAETTALEPAPPRSRKYTLTHNDITGNLRLTIGPDFNQQQISGFYTRLLRDEVVAEWVAIGSSGYALHVYCHVSGEERWLAPPLLRNYIFRREMPLVLDTLVYAERKLLRERPELGQAQVYVHFQSSVKELDTVEFWGVLGDRSTWPRGPTSILLRMIYAVVGWPPSLAAEPADLSIDLPAEPQDVETAVRMQQKQLWRQQQVEEMRAELSQEQQLQPLMQQVRATAQQQPEEQGTRRAKPERRGEEEDQRLQAHELAAQQLEQQRRWEQQRRRRQELGGRGEAQAPALAVERSEGLQGTASAQAAAGVAVEGRQGPRQSGQDYGSQGGAQREEDDGEAVLAGSRLRPDGNGVVAEAGLGADVGSRRDSAGGESTAARCPVPGPDSNGNGNGYGEGNGAGFSSSRGDLQTSSASNEYVSPADAPNSGALRRGDAAGAGSRANGRSFALGMNGPADDVLAKRDGLAALSPQGPLPADVAMLARATPLLYGDASSRAPAPVPCGPVPAAARRAEAASRGPATDRLDGACTGEVGCACLCSRAGGEGALEVEIEASVCGEPQQQQGGNGVAIGNSARVVVPVDRGPELVGARASTRAS